MGPLGGGTSRMLALVLLSVTCGCNEKPRDSTSSSHAASAQTAPTISRDASTPEPPKAPQTTAPVENLTNVEQHGLLQKTLGFYAVFLPEAYSKSDQRYPLVVILHGSGSTELNHGQLANDFGREQAIYVAPRAPYPHHEVFI